MAFRGHYLISLLFLTAAGIGPATPAAAQVRQRPLSYSFQLGLQVPVGAAFALEFGIDVHQIQTKPSTRFYTVQLGVLFH